MLLVGALAGACGGDSQGNNPAVDAGGTLRDAGNMPDLDQDEWPDGDDNCPALANPEQRDRDRDGFGDACDTCPATPNHGQNGRPGQDACDVVPESEPNDLGGSGAPLVLSGAGRILEVRGAIEPAAAGDQAVDRFALMVPPRTMLHVRVARTSGDSLLEPALVVSGGAFTASRIAEGLFVAERDIYVASSGTYELTVTDRRGLLGDEPHGADTYGYALAIEQVPVEVESLVAPIDGRSILLPPLGKVPVLQLELPASPRVRIATETELGQGRAETGVDTILVVERADGTVTENDDVASGYLDSRVFAATAAIEPVRVVLDHHRVIGGAGAELEVRLFVDAPPVEQELEPNDLPELAQALVYPGETSGEISEPRLSEPDVDWYTIEATAGQISRFYALLAPNAQIDPFLAVGRVRDGTFEAEFVNLDSSGISARTDAVFAESGTYHLAIGDQRNGVPPFRGGALYGYRIFAEVTGIQPASVLTSTGTLDGVIDPGGRVVRHVVSVREPVILALDTVELGTPELEPRLAVYGPAAVGELGAGGGRALVYLPSAASFVVGVHNGADGAGGPDFTYSVSAVLIPTRAIAETEPNDAPGSEDTLGAPGVVEGALSEVTDVDRHALALQAGDTLDAALPIGARGRTLELWAPGGAAPLASGTQLFDVAIPTGGSYTLVIATTAEAGPYTLVARVKR